MTKLYQSVVTGVGASLPKTIVTNKDLTKRVDTSEEWIVERTGIQERRIASDDETTSSLGAEAAKFALKDAKLENTDIDMIILATATPDNTFPASATVIQSSLLNTSLYEHVSGNQLNSSMVSGDNFIQSLTFF